MTLHAVRPVALDLDVSHGGATRDDALDAVQRAIEPGSYRRTVFKDRG